MVGVAAAAVVGPWDAPLVFVVGCFVVCTAGALLPVRLEEREDHIILTIAASAAGGVLGVAVLPLLWAAMAVAIPFVCAWSLLPRHVDRIGWPGARRSVAWLGVSGFAITVGALLGLGVYVAVLDGTFPVPLRTVDDFLRAGVLAFVAWTGTMAVRLASMRILSGSFARGLSGGLDPIDSPLAPYLMPLMGGFPLVAATVALYDAAEPWPSILILWWCFPIYAATAFDLHRRRLAQDLRRDALAAQRLAAIGEVSARIVHQSRHQVGLMGWSLHRLRALVEASDLRESDAAATELDALADAKDRLAEMLAAELLHERASGPATTPGGTGETGGTIGDAVSGVVEQLAAEAEREAVTLTVDVAPGPGGAPAPAGFADVVFNLVDNAIDAAAGSVGVVVGGAPAGGWWVAVHDDGPGLGEVPVDRAVEPFFTTKADGTGMGLAIADALVSEAGGSLDYVRRDGTTTFTLRFSTIDETGVMPGT